VRRAAAIVLLLVFALLGTGALRFVHDLGHAHEDAAARAEHGGGGGHHGLPVHTEWNCELHALLTGPIVATSAVPLLILLGLFVAFLTELTPAAVPRRPAFRFDCRGPPAC
jgi:hypothetical protein